MALGPTSNPTRLALLLWVLVASFYFYLSYDYIRITMNDREFEEYMKYVVQHAGNSGRNARDIRKLLLARAEQLSLPLSSEQIVVRGGGHTLDVAVTYNVDIDIPVIERQFYIKNFEHAVRYQVPR